MVLENEENVNTQDAVSTPAEGGNVVQQEQSQVAPVESGEKDWAKIEELTAKGEYHPSYEEANEHAKWVEAGRPERKKAEEVNPPAEDPAKVQTVSDEDLLRKDSKTLTDEEAERVSGLLKRFNVRSVSELPEAMKRFDDEQNARKGEMGREIQQLRQELNELRGVGKAAGMGKEDLRALMEDFSRGDPQAIRYVKEELGLDIGGGPKTVMGVPQQQTPKMAPVLPDEAPEDIVDSAAWKYMKQMEQQYRQHVESLQGRVEQLSALSEAGKRFAAEAAEIRKEEAARSAFRTQVLKLVEQFPEDYKPASGDMVGMIDNLYAGKAADPRIAPVQAVLDYAVARGIPDLEAAHYALNGPKFRQTLAQVQAEAERRGREQVLHQPRTVGLSGKRADGGEGAYTQVSAEQLDQILAGRAQPPSSWWSERAGRLFIDPAKVPPEYHGKVFPGGVQTP